MHPIIRQETPKDHQTVFQLIKTAFQSEPISDYKEQFLVERLRISPSFVPELSLVAQVNNTVVGHILLTKVKIKNNHKEFDSLALAPVSVLPKYQKNGIGGKLIKETHRIARTLGHTSIVLLGHEHYYPRFGYQPAHLFDIVFPFDAPKENCMVLSLTENGLEGVQGTVVYPKEFSE